MFGSVNNLDDELEFDTRFFPVTTSTQSLENVSEKRKNDLIQEEKTKRFKIDTPQNVGNSLVKVQSSENHGKESFSPSRVAKRMFPGPAGLLTDLGNNSESTCHNTSDNIDDFLLCSQQTVSTFMDRPWTMMKTDYYSHSTEQLYDKYTISWIKKKYCAKNVSFICKAPFLAAVIQNLETVDAKIPSIHITLKDPTGVIDGTILYSFYKGISKHLTVGSVVILKQFGVLTNQYGHCLTITANNLLVIYHRIENTTDCDKDKNDHVEKMVFQKCSMDDILKEAHDAEVLQRHTDSYKQKPTFSNSKTNNIDHHLMTNTSLVSNKKNNSNFIVPKLNKIVSTNNSSLLNPNVLQNMDICQNTLVSTGPSKKFVFKKTDHSVNPPIDAENIVISCSQMSVKADKKDTEIWKNVLENVDTDSLFGDF
ncbi:uncharacterized protein LOC130443134 [Diorhabda sublineata]|uniref:uncharacterized protein LOC130443134 n=1 Tax=Diorhabda sublineata TaxID=1163346 RepID=UPI0024E18C9F|nr:uncharacterized protein LOC130443134 [Diorhabda sublineata]